MYCQYNTYSIPVVLMVAEMSKLWALVGVVCASIVAINGGNFGVALWTTTAINKCEEPSHKFKFDVTLMVVNETHNGLYGYLELDEDFTKDHGVRIDMYKYHEDEFNMFEVLYDDHMFEFFNKYASKYVKGCFNAAGIDPPAIPLVKGKYKLDEFVYSKEIMPGLFGTYLIKLYIMKNDVEEGCIEVQIEGKEFKDPEE